MSEKTISPHELQYIQSHRNLDFFNYELAIDWAISLIRQGIESDNVLMLASFHLPIDSVEIRPYVAAVLEEQGLRELDGEAAIRAKIKYHLAEILKDNAIRNHLDILYTLYLSSDDYSSLMNFYFLYHAWNELEEIGRNFYFEGADLNNIEAVLKDEAGKWMEQYGSL